MATFFQYVIGFVFFAYRHKWKALGLIIASMLIALGIGKIYQHWDDDDDRGAIPIHDGALGENFETPVYLDQGWSASESLWFYNTTQGSGLMPYDLFLVLEQPNSDALFRSNDNMDRFRYLPQKPTFFNPDGLPVGFVKDSYQGKDHIGYTCAACHTGQVNYTDSTGKTTAIRIDGGPAMADMVTFLTELETALQNTLDNPSKQKRFVENVLGLHNDYRSKNKVIESLQQSINVIHLYNTVNHSKLDYGYARLDAFGRIYNRVLQHVINKDQLKNALLLVDSDNGQPLLSETQINHVLKGVNKSIILDDDFSMILNRLTSTQNGYPGLSHSDMLRIRNIIFNEPNAPVSYPFLWDIAQSDYVQWNGLASNNGVGPLGRNTGEVIGVFGILDWTSHKAKSFSLAASISGQEHKKEVIDFTSSIDVTNLQRLESHLKGLQSPQWPEDILGKIDPVKARRGQAIYANYCQACHEIIDRSNFDRIVIAHMSAVNDVGTDPKTADNSVNYRGKSGNFKHTLQSVANVGSLIIEENAPVIQILTSATKGVIATPDADKWFIRRWLDRLYVIGLSFLNNKIPNTVKSGQYQPDNSSNPYNSLLAYKGRSLNGIWATAPYLHNGSVPTLYDLLLPKKTPSGQEDGVYRPDTFMVGSRELDVKKVGFRYTDYDGTRFDTSLLGNHNTGHEYGAGKTAQPNGQILPALTEAQRWDLIEFLKSL